MKRMIIFVLCLLIAAVAGAQTITDISMSQLPKATRDYIAENMPNANITRTVKIDDKGITKYGVVFESNGRKRALIFDKDGKFLTKAENLEQATGPVHQANPQGTGTTSTTPSKNPSPPSQSPSSGTQSKDIPPERLPSGIIKYINTTFPNGKILLAKQLKIGSVPIYQVKVDDGVKEHIITFNGKGNYLSKRSYASQANQKKQGSPEVRKTPTENPQPVNQDKPKETPSTNKAPAKKNQQPASETVEEPEKK
jgi:hypothetical protein